MAKEEINLPRTSLLDGIDEKIQSSSKTSITNTNPETSEKSLKVHMLGGARE